MFGGVVGLPKKGCLNWFVSDHITPFKVGHSTGLVRVSESQKLVSVGPIGSRIKVYVL